MDNKTSDNILDNNKLNKDDLENSLKRNNRHIPINISLVKNIFTIPQYKDKNIIYINDIETLNDSSLTNNPEQTNSKFNLNESSILSQSNNSSKEKNTKNKKINHNNYLKNELIIKENENYLLKKELFKLKEELYLLQNKVLKLKKNEQNLEKSINEIKKEYQLKEKVLLKTIEQLKNEIKNKNIILTSFQEKFIIQNQSIERLKIQLKKKESQINELNRKYKKYNLDTNNNISNLHLSKEKENLNSQEKNIKLNSGKNKIKANSGRQSTSRKKIKKIISKEKIKNENKEKNYLFQLQHYHSNTFRENNKNSFFLENQNSQKVISLKKRTKLYSPVLYKFKSKNLNKSKKDIKENTNYIKINLGNKFKGHSFSDKSKQNYIKTSDKSILNDNLRNLKHIFLQQGKNSEDAFIKRYSNSNQNKYLKKNINIKNSFRDNSYVNTNSYIYLESELNRKNYKIDIPKFNKRKNNSFVKYNNNSNTYSNTYNDLEQKKDIKGTFNEKLNKNLNKNNENLLFPNNYHKKSILVKKYFIDNRINLLCKNTFNNSNSNLTNNNNNVIANTIKLFDNNSTKSNKTTNDIFKEYHL